MASRPMRVTILHARSSKQARVTPSPSRQGLNASRTRRGIPNLPPQELRADRVIPLPAGRPLTPSPGSRRGPSGCVCNRSKQRRRAVTIKKTAEIAALNDLFRTGINPALGRVLITTSSERRSETSSWGSPRAMVSAREVVIERVQIVSNSHPQWRPAQLECPITEG